MYACNLGDSRIFLLRGNKLQKISVDHVAEGTIFKKPPLTQHIGIPTDEFRIDPYIVSLKIRKGDRFLICSDGLTDMLSFEDIEAFLVETHSISDCVNDMMKMVYAKGAIDNTACPKCGKKLAMKEISRKTVSSYATTVDVERKVKNNKGEVIRTYTEAVPATHYTYDCIDECKFCGHRQEVRREATYRD